MYSQMNVLPPAVERVTHVVFRCGCVRSLRTGETMLANCPFHKENMLSFTEEYLQLGQSGN